MTNRDVIRLLQAKLSEDIIITKIKQSKTHFDTSVDALVALRTAGATDRLTFSESLRVITRPGDQQEAAGNPDQAPPRTVLTLPRVSPRA